VEAQTLFVALYVRQANFNVKNAGGPQDNIHLRNGGDKMKSLIITVGEALTLGKWLGTLRGAGAYNGDILILDYDGLPQDVLDYINSVPNIYLLKVERILSDSVIMDRHLTIHNALATNKELYDVAMACDCDMIFCKPVQPLLDEATDSIVYTEENHRVEHWTLNCITANDLKNVDCPSWYGEVWDKMLKKPAINGGLYLGPVDLMIQLESFMVNNVIYGLSDQLWLNTALYGALDIPAKPSSSYMWNYDSKNGYKRVGNKVYDYTGKHEINIIHFMGKHAKYKQAEWT